jgi:hypothetical protein
MTTRTRSAAALLLALVLAGCGGGGSAKKKAAACGRLEGAATTSAHGGDAPPGEALLLTDVRADSGRCTDRITFEFRDDSAVRPGFLAEYRPASEAQTEDGSGRRIDVEGSAFLVVRLEPAATADISGDDVVPTYTGPRRIAPDGTRHVREAVKTGDFEAAVTWTIGLDERRPFKVMSSSSPPRVAVEIG